GGAARAARLQPVPHLRLPDARLLRVAARGGARAPAVPDRRDAPGPAPVPGRAAGVRAARGADPEEPRAAAGQAFRALRVLRPQPRPALRAARARAARAV